MHEHDDDIDSLGQRLRAERPVLSPEAASSVRGRVLARTDKRSTGRVSSALVVGCLGLGVLFSGGGTALAVSGLAGDGSALRQQYPGTSVPGTTSASDAAPTLGGGTTSAADQGGVAGVSASGGDDDGTGSGSGSGSDAASGADPALDPADVKAAPQLIAATAGDNELPYTGLAAIPVLLLGASLLVVGLALRRRTRGLPG